MALRRPYTVAVMAFLIMILGIMAIKSMMVDIFPVIDIPVVNVIWNYTGLSAADMERKVVLLSERGISSSVDLVQLAKRPALIVLNAVPPRGGMGDQAAEAIRGYGIPVAEVRVSQRATFNHSLTAGQTVPGDRRRRPNRPPLNRR